MIYLQRSVLIQPKTAPIFQNCLTKFDQIWPNAVELATRACSVESSALASAAAAAIRAWGVSRGGAAGTCASRSHLPNVVKYRFAQNAKRCKTFFRERDGVRFFLFENWVQLFLFPTFFLRFTLMV